MTLLNRTRPVALLLLVSAAASADEHERAELLLTSGQTRIASIASLTGDRVAFKTDAGTTPLQLNEVVRWGSRAQREARPTILLRDGSQIVAAPVWSRRGSVQLEDDQWLLVNHTLRSIRLPRAQVRAVWFGAAGERAVDEPLRREAATHDEPQDRVWLDSGDALAGAVTSIKERSLWFTAAGEEVEIELARVEAVALAGGAPAVEPALAIGLRDGSLLCALEAKINDASLAVKLTTGEFVAGRPASSVCFLQPFGPRVAYLSDRQPLNFKQTPYLGVEWPLAMDQGLTGRPLQAGDTRLLKGLAMHSAARAVYRLDGDWRRFDAQLAVDNSAGDAQPGGSVTFRVYVARGAGFEPAYESPVVRSGDAPLPVSVDVSGAQAIALLVDYAEHGDQQDHADWLEARLVK